MSNVKKLVHTVACLIALSVISIPFYTAVQATSPKGERPAMAERRVSDGRIAALVR